jgi:hypothetical protein
MDRRMDWSTHCPRESAASTRSALSWSSSRRRTHEVWPFITKDREEGEREREREREREKVRQRKLSTDLVHTDLWKLLRGERLIIISRMEKMEWHMETICLLYLIPFHSSSSHYHMPILPNVGATNLL